MEPVGGLPSPPAGLPRGDVVERRRVLDGDDPLSDHYGVYAVVELRRERP